MAWYAKFDGVDGSSKQKDHDKWSNISSVNMGGHKAGGGGTGVGRVGGKLHMDDISMGLISDKALPKLLEAAELPATRTGSRKPAHLMLVSGLVVSSLLALFYPVVLMGVHELLEKFLHLLS